MNIKFFHLALTFLLLLGVGSTKVLAVSSNTTMQHQTNQGEDDDEDESQTSQGEKKKAVIGIRIDDTIIKNTGEVTAPWLKSGSVYYDAENKTLTLDNAIIEDEYFDTALYFMASNVPGLQIITKGNSSISSTRRRLIVSTQSITFLGGILTLNSPSLILFAYANGWDDFEVVFRDCTLKATSQETSALCGSPNATIKFVNSSIDVNIKTYEYENNSSGIRDFDSINFEGCSLTPAKNYVFKKENSDSGNSYLPLYRVITIKSPLLIRPLSSIAKSHSVISNKTKKKTPSRK